MQVIEIEKIHENPYAPEGSDAVCLYNLGDGKELTFGQLVLAVCIGRGASIEHRSVQKANELSNSSGLLKALSAAEQQVMSDSVSDLSKAYIDLSQYGYTPSKCSSNTSLYDFFTVELGLTLDYGKDNSSYTAKMSTYKKVREVMDNYTKTSQQQAIDLQSLVNARDVAYNTSSSILSTMLKNGQGVASNF